MSKFLKHIALFFIPAVLYAILVLIIDPYNYFDLSNFIGQETKQRISAVINEDLYSLIKFEKQPAPGIILGDSRASLFKDSLFNKYSGIKFSNLSIGGENLMGESHTFWIVNSQVKLKAVYWGINFTEYTSMNANDMVKEAESVKSNAFSYIFSDPVFRSTFLILDTKIFHADLKLGVPTLSREAYWKYKMKTSLREYQTYSYPELYYQRLRKISNYCHEHKIKLVFFIPPTSDEIHSKVKEFHLERQESRFKADLISLGDEVYDFDVPSEFTKENSNFRDPFHMKIIFAERFVKEMLTSKKNQNSKTIIQF